VLEVNQFARTTGSGLFSWPEIETWTGSKQREKPKHETQRFVLQENARFVFRNRLQKYRTCLPSGSSCLKKNERTEASTRILQSINQRTIRHRVFNPLSALGSAQIGLLKPNLPSAAPMTRSANFAAPPPASSAFRIEQQILNRKKYQFSKKIAWC
jgi:hypothetical protein